MKRTILNLARVSGCFSFFRMINRRRALILTYHRFSHGEENGKTSARAFAEQLAYLTAHYRVTPLSQMVEHLNRRGELPPGLAAITIDDGYRDAYEVAFPLLRRYQAPATLYVVTEFVERRIWLWTDKMRFLTAQARAQELTAAINEKEIRLTLSDDASRRAAAEKINSALKLLDDAAKDEAIKLIAAALEVELPATPPDEYAAINWRQAAELDRQGVEIGSHTLTHPILTKIGDDRLRRELRDSRAEIESQLKRRVEHFCYPNGDFNQQVRREAAEAGYGSAVTTVSGMNAGGDDLLTLRRVHTEGDLTHFIQSTSGFEAMKDRVRMLRRGSSLAQPAPLEV